MERKKAIVTGLLAGILIMGACSSKKISGDLTLEERMNTALELFNKKKYLDARTQFRVITLSHSGSNLADQAQFYLAECHFKLKEYILSAAEYDRLLKVYPKSDYVDDAKYKLGLSYYELSPKYALDQEYTLQAISHFQEFLEEYHTSEFVPQVEKMLREARGKLARKIFAAGEQYRKMGEHGAAILYFEMLLEKYYDSKYAPQAHYWIGECYRKQKRYDKAVSEFEQFLQRYPSHEYVNRAQANLADARDHID
ncbi:outer membrane protein assembly factor BamD [candidate division KSB1 bacterium]|nr:outer membrane protein assembly factor BamD [candidate division KSB1 bacterium]